MVTVHACLLIFIATTSFWAEDVKVTSEIINQKGVINQPLKGSITVTHEQKSTIDTSSFQLGDNPLKVEPVRSVKISPTANLMISFFTFTLPPQEKGLQVLPSISVKVGDKRFRSHQTTYEVVDGRPERRTEKEQGPSRAVLDLKAFINGSPTLYPGQRAYFIYRITYTSNVALTTEELPMLQAEGMRKIGDPDVQTFEEMGKYVQQISQLVETTKPGTFTYGPSKIAGYAYTLDRAGKKVYQEPPLNSVAPAISLTVNPFPPKGKPTSFSGAVGQYTMKVSLLSSPEVNVGDTMTIAIAISGEGEIDNIKMPEVCCQPGWSGVFKTSDLPPTVKIEKFTKTFTVNVRPTTTAITNIPPLEFSYYDPTANGYNVIKSKPISITVNPAPKAPQEKTHKQPEKPLAKQEWQKPSTIEISGNYPLTEADLYSLPFGTWYTLWIFPIGLVLLLVQNGLKQRFQQERLTEKSQSSQELFQEALNAPKNSSRFFHFLTLSLYTLLIEKKEIATTNISPEDLPEDGKAGHVRDLLMKIEEHRFAGQETLDYNTLITEAKKIFYE